MGEFTKGAPLSRREKQLLKSLKPIRGYQKVDEKHTTYALNLASKGYAIYNRPHRGSPELKLTALGMKTLKTAAMRKRIRGEATVDRYRSRIRGRERESPRGIYLVTLEETWKEGGKTWYSGMTRDGEDVLFMEDNILKIKRMASSANVADRYLSR